MKATLPVATLPPSIHSPGNSQVCSSEQTCICGSPTMGIREVLKTIFWCGTSALSTGPW